MMLDSESPKISFLDSVLLPYNFSFWDKSSKSSKIIHEVSACRFLEEKGGNDDQDTTAENSSYRLKLVGDSGELFEATLALFTTKNENEIRDNIRFKISLERQVPLIIPGYNWDEQEGGNLDVRLKKAVDAEGCEVFDNKFPDLILISSEEPLALTWFDRRTGWAETTTNASGMQSTTPLPSYRVPDYIYRRARLNLGFEAVTALSSLRVPSSATIQSKSESEVENGDRFFADSYILTTTEGHLKGDPPGFHRWLFWNTDLGGYPIMEMGHWASPWKEIEGDPDEYLLIDDMTYWPEQDLLLVLERGYDGKTNMIHLSTVQLTFPVSRRSHSLMNWTGDTMTLLSPPGESSTVKLPVDNYEAICLLPSSATKDNPNERLLLLINDENQNPKQIGTQFVLMRLETMKETGIHTKYKMAMNNLNISLIWIIISGTVAVLVGALLCWCRNTTDRSSNTKTRYQKADTNVEAVDSQNDVQIQQDENAVEIA